MAKKNRQKPFKPGATAYIGKRKVTIVRQVLSRIPAYRVKSRMSGSQETWVADGWLISAKPKTNLPLMMQIPEAPPSSTSKPLS